MLLYKIRYIYECRHGNAATASKKEPHYKQQQRDSFISCIIDVIDVFSVHFSHTNYLNTTSSSQETTNFTRLQFCKYIQTKISASIKDKPFKFKWRHVDAAKLQNMMGHFIKVQLQQIK